MNILGPKGWDAGGGALGQLTFPPLLHGAPAGPQTQAGVLHDQKTSRLGFVLPGIPPLPTPAELLKNMERGEIEKGRNMKETGRKSKNKKERKSQKVRYV